MFTSIPVLITTKSPALPGLSRLARSASTRLSIRQEGGMMGMITTKDGPQIFNMDGETATSVLRKLIPRTVAWVLSLAVCWPSMAWAQAVNGTAGINSSPVVEPTSGRRIVIRNTLEIETSGHGEASINRDIGAEQLHPANTPRINASTVQAPPSL